MIVTLPQREHLLRQKATLIFFTGLSGAGKSTLAKNLEWELFRLGFKTAIIDGDNLRAGLTNDLSFSREHRKENLRRVGEVSKLFLDSGIIVISAMIAPYRQDRTAVKQKVGGERFFEVFVDASLETCQERDVKGLYKKAKQGVIKNFTGMDDPYEIPETPDIHIRTDHVTIEQCVDVLLASLLARITLIADPIITGNR